MGLGIKLAHCLFILRSISLLLTPPMISNTDYSTDDSNTYYISKASSFFKDPLIRVQIKLPIKGQVVGERLYFMLRVLGKIMNKIIVL